MGRPRGKIIETNELGQRVESVNSSARVGISPEKLSASGTEHGHQSALFCWSTDPAVLAQFPELTWLHAIPNGGDRGSSISGAMMKAEGVKAGVFDLFLPVARGGWFGLYIEMKKPGAKFGDHRDMSDKQKQFGLFVHLQGYKTELCHSWLKARDVITAYLNQPKTTAAIL